ncbi:pollen Ole e 1 allergen and extensin family protein, partial [Striga asiatica]
DQQFQHGTQAWRWLVRVGLTFAFNNQFAFTAVGVKYEQELSQRNKESSLISQLYFHDTDHELANRLHAYPSLTKSITIKIMQVLENNPYAKLFRNLKCLDNLDNCRIDLKIVSQVAALLVEGQGDEELYKRHVQVFGSGGVLHEIQYYYGCYNHFQYP